VTGHVHIHSGFTVALGQEIGSVAMIIYSDYQLEMSNDLPEDS
jgi:hypothetical protein